MGVQMVTDWRRAGLPERSGVRRLRSSSVTGKTAISVVATGFVGHACNRHRCRHGSQRAVFSIPTTRELTWEGWIRPHVLNLPSARRAPGERRETACAKANARERGSVVAVSVMSAELGLTLR
jgi:hypothetical protein